jgi:eukaryotic-like serine/threonine-protein kinase
LSLRDKIASLVSAQDGAETIESPPLAVEVLERAGIRADQTVPPLTEAGLPTVPPVTILSEQSQGLFLTSGDLENRYRVGGKLGEGGMGVVNLAEDRNLGRHVAIKSIHPDRVESGRLARFVAEARITAQLEHPGIVPVHDLFISDEGDVFYTMKRVQGQSLGELIDALRSGDPATLVRNNVNHLLGLFRSTCQAVAYAHTRRVVHRDLKPANIMIGDFGEVLVMDWGVARLMDDAPEELRSVLEEGASVVLTADGAMVGSPAYMAPESMGTGGADVGPASDVFSLGVILYELLTLTRPFRADTVARLLYLVAAQAVELPSQRAPGREIPVEVEAVCIRALSKDPAERYPDAGALMDDLDGFLEGVRPRQEADRLVAEGRELMLLFARAASEAEEADMRVASMNEELEPWDPLEMKRLVWDAKGVHEDAVARADTIFGDCEAAFESALSHVRGHRPAQEGLADLYWIRFLQAEEAREPRWVRRWGELIQRYAPERYARRLQGDGTITLSTEPPGVEAILQPLSEVDGLRAPGTKLSLGATPIDRKQLPMGSWQLNLQAAGFATVTAPLVVARLQNLSLNVRMRPADSVRAGFLPVPGGPVNVGGDGSAISGLPESFVEVRDFAIARYPVTVAEYFEYLADLTPSDPEAARRRSPRVRGGRGVRQPPLVVLDPDGSYELPFTDADGTVWHAEQPIVSVALEDARAYAQWRSGRDGVEYRLPTEREWEKAARGLDRRLFPWGDVFDASFCVMSESSPEPPDLPAVGAVPSDVSPYGVRDLGGGVRDWCEWDEAASTGGRSPLRGGSYGTVEVYCRCASRSEVHVEYVGSHVGFRLVQDLSGPESASQPRP